MADHVTYFANLAPWDGYGLSSCIFLSQFHERVTLAHGARKEFGTDDAIAAFPEIKTACTYPVPITKWNIDHLPAVNGWGSGPFGQSKKKVIATQWELHKIPETWRPVVAQYDIIIVPTYAQIPIFMRGGVERSKIKVIPEFVDTDFWSAPKTQTLAGDKVRFITWGVMQQRKCPNEIINAFRKAFRDENDVELTIKTYGHFKQIITHNDPRITVIDEIYDAKRLRDLVGSHDVVLCISKGEGYGCTVVQGMAMGKPVILNGAFSQQAFLDRELNYPITDGPLEPFKPSQGYLDDVDGSWYTPDEEALTEAMRRVYEKRDEARIRGAKAKTVVKEKYGIPTVRKMWEQFLNNLD